MGVRLEPPFRTPQSNQTNSYFNKLALLLLSPLINHFVDFMDKSLGKSHGKSFKHLNTLPFSDVVNSYY